MRWAFRAYLVGGLLTGCGSKNTPSPEQELTVQHHEVMRLTTRFRVEQVEEEIPAKHAFLIRKACPKIRKASLRKEKGATMALLTISGEQMETVWGVLGRSVDGNFGIAPVKRREDGSLRFAVQCGDCDLHLGMLVDDRKVACIGPGHSLKIRAGVLSHY